MVQWRMRIQEEGRRQRDWHGKRLYLERRFLGVMRSWCWWERNGAVAENEGEGEEEEEQERAQQQQQQQYLAPPAASGEEEYSEIFESADASAIGGQQSAPNMAETNYVLS